MLLSYQNIAQEQRTQHPAHKHTGLFPPIPEGGRFQFIKKFETRDRKGASTPVESPLSQLCTSNARPVSKSYPDHVSRRLLFVGSGTLTPRSTDWNSPSPTVDPLNVFLCPFLTPSKRLYERYAFPNFLHCSRIQTLSLLADVKTVCSSRLHGRVQSLPSTADVVVSVDDVLRLVSLLFSFPCCSPSSRRETLGWFPCRDIFMYGMKHNPKVAKMMQERYARLKGFIGSDWAIDAGTELYAAEEIERPMEIESRIAVCRIPAPRDDWSGIDFEMYNYLSCQLNFFIEGEMTGSEELALETINWKSAPMTVINKQGNNKAQYPVSLFMKKTRIAPTKYPIPPSPMMTLPLILDTKYCPR